MTRIGFAAIVIALLVSPSTVRVFAKGPTVKVSISGPGLASRLDVTTAGALVSIWADTGFLAGLGLGSPGRPFIGLQTQEPDRALPRYCVSFWVLDHSQAQPDIEYSVTYVYDPSHHRGVVYLPGKGDPNYHSQAIARPGDDGRWHVAANSWSDAILDSRLTGINGR